MKYDWESDAKVFSRTIELIRIWKHPKATPEDLFVVALLLSPFAILDAFAALPEYIIKKRWRNKEPKIKVRITRGGDSAYKVGEHLELEKFVELVRLILENGGEMPAAVVIPTSTKGK